jgi:hypothetical protein
MAYRSCPLFEANIGKFPFVPPEIVSQLMEVRHPDLAEERLATIVRCLSQGIDKESDPRHFIRATRRSLDQRIPFKDSEINAAFLVLCSAEKYRYLGCPHPDRLRQGALNFGDMLLGKAFPIDHAITVRHDRLQSRPEDSGSLYVFSVVCGPKGHENIAQPRVYPG